MSEERVQRPSGKANAINPQSAEEQGSNENSTTDQSTHDFDSANEEKKKRFIGAYQIVREIGEGGMGTVYLGVRADQEFKKHVAIKIIRKGMDSKEIVARFRRERQILASLDHPNIAKLLDGGSTEEDGLPYFVMEHIQGRPLTDYCDSHKLNTKERLQLFRTICSAVQYAHQNLVVHRDLKPANILVTADGIPKLLDFGIAKLLNPDIFGGSPPTATEMRVMTPDYASPEQVRGEPITTSSDIYSMGIILYELLAGRRPYQITNRNHLEMYRVVCEQEPGKPSTAVTRKQEANTDRLSRFHGSTPEKLQKELRGDLDNIILMALRKEPQRRYPSAEAFSEDIRKYLEGHPVQARKGTWTYRAGKYVKRHKAGVAAATVVFLLLIAFGVTSTIQNVRIALQRDAAEKQKAKAQAEAQKAEKVTQFLTDLFEVNDPAKAKGQTITAREILDKGAQSIRSEMKDQPEVRAKLMNTLGVIYEKLGLYDQAMPLLKEALKIRKRLYGSEHVAVAESLDNLALILGDKGQLDESEKLYREALAINRKLLGNESPDVATDLNNLAGVLADKGQLDEAEKLYREALAINRKLLGNEHPYVAATLDSLAQVLEDKGQLDEAEKLFREALALHRKLLGNQHPYVATDLNNLAGVLRAKDQFDEAEKLFREALALDRKLLGSEHPEVATVLDNLAGVLEDKGQLDEAEKLRREALAMNRKLLGNEHPYVAKSLAGLAEIIISKGDQQTAVSLLNDALAIPLEKMPEDNKFRARAKSALGACYLAQRKYPEAEPLLLDAYKVLSVQEKGSKRAKLALQRIIDLYQAWGKSEKLADFRKKASS